MRCPHCAGEIPDASRYCGICGRGTADGPSRSAPWQGDPNSASLFALPVSRGARVVRVVMVLVLDAMLAGAGIAMIVTYLQSRSEVAGPPAAADAGVAGKVTVLPPQPVRKGEAHGAADTPEPQTERAGEPRKGARPAGAKPRVPAPPATGRSPRPDTEPPPPSAPSVATGPAARTEPAPVVPPAGEGADAGEALSDEEVQALAARIGAVVDGHQRQIERCYSQATKVFAPDDPLKGRIDLRFTVMPNGTATSVSVARNSTRSEPLGLCMRGLVSSWSFPSASQPTDFIWPFQFSPPK